MSSPSFVHSLDLLEHIHQWFSMKGYLAGSGFQPVSFFVLHTQMTLGLAIEFQVAYYFLSEC